MTLESVAIFPTLLLSYISAIMIAEMYDSSNVGKIATEACAFKLFMIACASSLSKSNHKHFLKNKKVILSKTRDVENCDNILIESIGEVFTKEIYEKQKYISCIKFPLNLLFFKDALIRRK